MASSTPTWKQVSGLMTSHRAGRILTVETKCKVRRTKLYCNHGDPWQAYYIKEMQHSRCYLSNGRTGSSLWGRTWMFISSNVEHEHHEWIAAHSSWLMQSVMCKTRAVPADGAKRPDLSLSAVVMVRSYATDRPTDLSTVTSSRDSVVWNH